MKKMEKSKSAAKAVATSKRNAPSHPGTAILAQGTLPKYPPTYFSVDGEAAQRAAAGRKRPPKRRRVEHEDPAFATAVNQQIQQIEDAVARLTHLTSTCLSSPAAVVALQNAVRAALDAYVKQLAEQ